MKTSRRVRTIVNNSTAHRDSCTWWVTVSGPVWRLQEESGPLLTTALHTETPVLGGSPWVAQYEDFKKSQDHC